MAGRPYVWPSPRIVTRGRCSATTPTVGELSLTGLAPSVLDGAAHQLNELDSATHAGAHVHPRVELAKVGDHGVQFLQQIFGLLHAFVGPREQCRVRPGRGPVRAHDVRDVEPLALEVVENAYTLFDGDHQFTWSRGDDADVPARALRAEPCRELRVGHLPNRLHTHPDAHLDVVQILERERHSAPPPRI